MRPEHKEYLDELRKMGIMNMYGAGLPLREKFGMTRMQAHAVLFEWMKGLDKPIIVP